MKVRYRDLVKPWAADPRSRRDKPLLPTTKAWFRMTESERLEARDQILAALAALAAEEGGHGTL